MSLHISQCFDRSGASVTVNLHDLKSAKAGQGIGGHGWVTFKDDTGSSVALHVDFRLAEMLAEAFAEYEDWQSSQEGPTFDDALAAKCAAQGRVEDARRLK